MYKKTKVRNLSRFIPHPHFKDDVGNGFRILPDAPQIESDLDPQLFSLRLNRLNGRNLDPCTIEESNRLSSMASLTVQSRTLESSIEKEIEDAEVTARAERFKQEIENIKKENENEQK